MCDTELIRSSLTKIQTALTSYVNGDVNVAS